MPTQIKFYDIMGKLEEVLAFYEQTSYKYNQYQLYLANGTRLEFDFSKKRLAHLLGIKVGGFQTNKILQATNAENLLDEIAQRYSYVYQKCSKGEARYFDLFSEYMEEKLEYIKQVLPVPFDNIQFVVQYNRDNAYLNGVQLAHPCDYYLAFLNEMGEYIFLGLLYDEKCNRLVPASLLCPSQKKDNQQLLHDLIQNQTISLVTSKNLLNNGAHKNLPLNEKITRLTKLSELAKEHGAVLDASKEVVYLSNLSRNLIAEKNSMRELLTILKNAILYGKSISEDAIFNARQQGVDNALIELLNTYNENVRFDTSQDGLLAELKEAKKQILSLQQALQQKEIEVEELTGENKQKDSLLEEQQIQIASQDTQLQKFQSFQEEAAQLYKKYYGKTG